MTELLSPPTGAPSPADRLRARLDDPEVASALNLLLDHADVLALAALSVDGLLRNGESLSDNLGMGLKDLRGVADSAQFLAAPTKRLADNAPQIADAADALLASGMLSREVVTLLGQLANALVDGANAAQRNRTSISGVMPVIRALRDPDVGRGLGMLIEVARALGRSMDAAPGTATLSNRPAPTAPAR